jgi:hypothetical protein
MTARAEGPGARRHHKLMGAVVEVRYRVRLMRRPQSAFGLAAVIASLSVACLFAVPAAAARLPVSSGGSAVMTAGARVTGGGRVTANVRAAASRACTDWTSELAPPSTIRVLRTKRDQVPKDVAGTVQEVDFRDYVAVTMAAEWPEHYPLETLKAGAVATKQFAWYYVIHPRGGTVKVDGQEVCYDVVDSTVDQYYYPEVHGIGKPGGPGPKIMAALDETWKVSLRKFHQVSQSSTFFLTGYRAGTTDRCGADRNGFKLYHRSTRACGLDGLKYRQILRLYLNPNLEIVTPGRHDIIRSRNGDAAAMVQSDDGQQVAHVWAPGDTAAGSRAGVRIAADELVGYASADMDRDGKDDLVWLVQTGPRTGRVRVALSDGDGYGPEQTWYEGGMLVPLGGARLLLGDFHADGRVDVGILARGESDGSVQVAVLRKKPGNAFAAPVRWWTGQQDMGSVSAAWAGDLSGDGRADLILRQNRDAGGVRLKTAVTKSPLPKGEDRMSPLRLVYETDLDAANVKTVTGDANRDGREDVLLLSISGGRAHLDRLQGQNLGAFKRVPLWTAPRTDPVAVQKTRLGAADVDYDGMTDLVLFTRDPDGTRIRVLRARYDGVRAGFDVVEPLDWSTVRPY